MIVAASTIVGWVASCDAVLDIREFPPLEEDAGTRDGGGTRDATVGVDGTADDASDAQPVETDAGDSGLDAVASATCASGCPIGAACDGGVCVCPAGETVCNGACVNEQTSPEHCGGCGLACPTGCTAGRCVVTLHSGGNPEGIAVNRTEAYWANADGVWSVLLDGGAATSFSGLGGATLAVALNATNVYWTEWSIVGGTGTTGSVGTAFLDGGSKRILASGQELPEAIALDTKNVYWLNNVADAGTVMMQPLVADGGGAIALASSQDSPAVVAADGISVYWTVSGTATDAGLGTGSVQRLTLGPDGGPSVILAAGQNHPAGIAVDAVNVYWANAGAGTIMRVPISGGTAVTLATSADPGNLAVDGDSLYWVDRKAGLGMKVPLDGGATTSLVSGLILPVGIVVDSTSVYVTDYGHGGGDGLVLKITPK